MTDELANLKAENQRLQDRVDWLEVNLLGRDLILPAEWPHLTKSEAALVRVLIQTPGVVSREKILTAIYPMGDVDEPKSNIVNVFLCKLREKLAPFGVTIENHFAQGFSINKDVRRAVLSRSQEAA